MENSRGRVGIAILGVFVMTSCTSVAHQEPDCPFQKEVIHHSLDTTGAIAEEIQRRSQLQAALNLGAELSTSESEALKKLNQRLRVRGIEGRIADLGGLEMIAQRNSVISESFAANESKLYPSGERVPKTCIAMSGGGSRSALFNVGALTAHFDAGGRPFDVYSSVSGGGYALGWLFQSLVKEDGNLAAATRRLDIDPKLVSWNISILYSPACLSSSAVRSFSAAIGNKPRRHSVLENGCRDAYAFEIGRAYGSLSAQRNELRRIAETAKVGLPIWNWSAFSSLGFDTETSIVEASPMYVGSDGLGFNRNFPSGVRDMNDVAAISGAAIDRALGRSAREGRIDPSYFRLGGYANLAGACTRLDGSERATSGDRGIHVYLSDGGETDNLGLVALVRRQCDEITVIDAEFDPHWVFEGVEIARQVLLRDHGVTFKMDKNFEDIVNVTRADTYDRADGVSLPMPSKRCDEGGAHAECLLSKRSEVSGFVGEIGPIPTWDGASVRLKSLKVKLIKLGITPFQMQSVLYAASIYATNGPLDQRTAWAQRKDWLLQCAASPSCAYPHTPTTNQMLSQDEGNLYYLLGRIRYEVTTK